MMKKITSIALLVVMVTSCVAFAAMPSGHWFEGSVDEASTFYPLVKHETFGPDGYITYSQFAGVATNAIGRAIAYSTDKANNFMTRYEILNILCERLDLASNPITAEQEITTAIQIADFNDMPQEYKQVALLCVYNGIIKGDENGLLNLDKQATYAEVLTIFIRARKL
ncbi:MAG: S-layer homology domain-containing protein [Eubacteriales bacterium]|nr:S-layer homology domain-containing protein [Eubacteriales bacterium]